MMLANDLKTYYDEVRRYLDCPKDEQDRLLLSVNKQVIELQVDNPNLDYDGIVEFLGEPESLAASLMERLSPDVVQKFKKKKRRLRLSIIACVAVVVVALSTLTIYTTTRQSNVHITEENYTFVDDNKVDDNKNVLDVENAVSYVEMYGDNVIEKHGINRDSTGDREKTRYLCGKQGIFTRDRALIRPGFIRQLETRASTRSASFFHALGSPGRPHNGGGEAGAYRTRNGAKPLKQGHLRAKRGPLGPSRKSQQQTKRTGFAAHGHSIAETAPEGKRASCANGALIRA